MSTTKNITARTGKVKTRAEADRLLAELARTVAEAPENQRYAVMHSAALHLEDAGVLTRAYAETLRTAAIEAGVTGDEK